MAIDNTKLKKIFRYTFIAVLTLTVFVGVYVAFDYVQYNSFKQSRFFGSKDSYSQSQSLYFDDIKVTVSEVEHTKKWVIADNVEECNTIFPPKFVQSEFARYFGGLDGSYDVNATGRENCIEALDERQSRKNLVVHYFIENLNSNPVDLGDYFFRIGGSEDIDNIGYTSPNIEDLLANQSRYTNIWVEVPREANDFALIVSKYDEQKQIQLELPELMESN